MRKDNLAHCFCVGGTDTLVGNNLSILTKQIIKALFRVCRTDLVNEANFRSRLKQYLEQEMPKGMLEYKVEEEIRKRLEEHSLTWVPDIIIHKPSRIYDIPVREGNLAIIELKLHTSERDIIHVFRKLKDYRKGLDYGAGFLIYTQSRSNCIVQIENLPNNLAGNWKKGYLHEIGYDTNEGWLVHAWYTKNGCLRMQEHKRAP